MKKIVSEKYVSIVEVKEIMVERKKSPPFDFEQEKTLDYASKFARLGKEDSDALVAKLSEAVSPLLAVKIADVVPDSPELVKLLFMQEKIEPDEAKVSQVLAIVKEYKPLDTEKIVKEAREKVIKAKKEEAERMEQVVKEEKEAAAAKAEKEKESEVQAEKEADSRDAEKPKKEGTETKEIEHAKHAKAIAGSDSKKKKKE